MDGEEERVEGAYGDMTRGSVNTVKVPDSLGGAGVEFFGYSSPITRFNEHKGIFVESGWVGRGSVPKRPPPLVSSKMPW